MSGIHDKDRQLYTCQDLLSWSPPPIQRIIAGGILNIQNRMVIFGDEGSYKSMLAQHTAHCLSRGSTWFGFDTNPCNVYKLQVELPLYMERARLEKYSIASKRIYLVHLNGNKPKCTKAELDILSNNYAYPTNIINRTEQFINIDEKYGFDSLKRNIELTITELPNRPLVVILDPLYKMFNRDLSSEVDIKPLFDKIDVLMNDLYEKSKVGVSFIIIHHTRKSKLDEEGVPISVGSQDAFGGRAFAWWADTMLRVDPVLSDRTDTKITMTFTKHRNADTVLPITTIQWDRDTLHPRILNRYIPQDKDSLGIRSSIDLASLE